MKRKASESDNCIKRFLQIKEFIHSFEYKIISHTSNIKDSIFEKLSNKQSIGIIQYKKQRCEYQKYFIDSYIENAKLIDSLVYWILIIFYKIYFVFINSDKNLTYIKEIIPFKNIIIIILYLKFELIL